MIVLILILAVFGLPAVLSVCGLFVLCSVAMLAVFTVTDDTDGDEPPHSL